VILIHIGDKNKAFLYRRQKRPFKDYLSLPGGRLLIKESIKQAAERIMKEKFNIRVKFKKIKSVSLEQVRKLNKIIHTFLLILVSAETKEKVELIDVNKNKKNIISSDYNLIINSNSEIKINSLTSITP
jgi:ADP-ribose pyrophosphatase YjhB (NUDIX family)